MACSQLKICRPSLSFDPVFMDHAECAEYNKKLNTKILWFLFFNLSWKIHWKLEWSRHKNDHNSKNKIGKILSLIFLSIQYIPNFSCKFEHFRKKKLFKNVRTFLKKLLFFWWGVSPPTIKHPGSGIFFLGLVGPSRNRLVSTAY